MATVASHGQCHAHVSLGQPLPTSTDKKHTLGKKRVPLRRRVVLHHAVRVQSQAGFFGGGTVKIKEEEGKIETDSEPSSGTKNFFKLPGTGKLPGTVKLQGKSQSQAKSNEVIFVAGATGKVGSRTVRELLKLGFRVRASTRNVEKAQALFENLGQTAPVDAGSDDESPFGFFSPGKLFGFLKPKSGNKLEFVECDLEDAESIEPALGNAGVVICCIGASEKEVLDVTGPYRIDFKATQNLIDAARSAQVSHFVLLTSLGTQKFGFPAAVLNLFWGVLLWKAKAEKALLQSELPYTIVRPGGMERPTDAYKETHNLILAEADKLFGGQVSNLQVAELLASIVENPDVSVNKIIEAVAETTAPLRPVKELLEEIPTKDDKTSRPELQSIRKTRPAKDNVAAPKASKKPEEEKFAKEKRAQALKEKEEERIQAEKLDEEKRAQAQKEKEEKRIQAEKDEKGRLKLQALRKKYEEEIETAREKEEAANSAAAAALAEKADLERRVAEVRAKGEAAALAASQAKAVEAAVLAAARKGNVLSDEEKQKIMESVKLARQPKEDGKPSSKKKPAFSFFGKAASSSTVPETATEVESVKETQKEKVKADAESRAKAKADKEAAADIAEKQQKEEKVKKEEEAKKVAQQEAVKALEAKKKEEEAKKLAEEEAVKALEAKKKEEQDKLEKEAKELAEKEAAKAAEAKRKEEELAEAKRKEEQEKAEKLKVEAEEKAKRKEEELAEDKRKEEQEKAEKLKVEAEEKARRKEEAAEAKRKEEAEAKRKEEQERAENLKVEAEEKPKVLAEQEAAAQEAAAAEAEKRLVRKEEPEEAAEAPAPARSKGFRWFWQPAEPEVEQSNEPEVTNVPVQAKVTQQLPPSSTPLSPYARYPGLQPPSPPIASPSAPKTETFTSPKIDLASSEINSVDQAKKEVGLSAEKDNEVTAKEPSKESEDDIVARTRQVEEIAAREKEALEKALAATAFKWPWQKPEPIEEESASSLKEEESASPSKEEYAASVQSKEKGNSLPPSSRPLSPYAQFPNLKPPNPPRASPPVQNGKAEESKVVNILSSSSTSLSPYPGFPELKPPTSPGTLLDEASNGAVPDGTVETDERIAEPAVTVGFKWPWQQ